jgi:hypothetical protein
MAFQSVLMFLFFSKNICRLDTSSERRWPAPFLAQEPGAILLMFKILTVAVHKPFLTRTKDQTKIIRTPLLIASLNKQWNAHHSHNSRDGQ